MVDLNKPVQYIKGVGPNRVSLLKKLGIETLGDLISFFPREHEDRSKPKNISSLVDGEEALISAFPIGRMNEIRIRKNLTICKLFVRDETGGVEIDWYNQGYLKNNFTINKRYCFYGKVSIKGGRITMQSPVYDLDGTNKTKVFECPSGVQIDTTYILNENDLYTFFIKSKSIETSSNSYTSVETERTLVKINLETGKYDELFKGSNREILGLYNNNIIWEEIDYKQDPENFLTDDTGYINNLNNSTKKIKLFNLSNLEETEIYKDIYKNMSEISCYNGKVYFIGLNSNKLECVNLQTKQKETVCELPKAGASIQGIYDNKLQYVYYAGNTGKVDSAYYIDLETNENKNFKLVDDNDYLVEILSENNDYYFVKTGYEMGDEYTSWAGTTQQDIEKTNYALIKKDDYWNSKAEYIDMQNTD